jgi:anti-sigma B factor antagonist
MQPQFEIQSEIAHGTGRVIVSGELDFAAVPRLMAEAEALLEQSARHLILDLGRMTFVDSSGLSLFIALNDRAAHEDWTLSLTKPPSGAFSVFTITGTDEHLPFVEDHSQ